MKTLTFSDRMRPEVVQRFWRRYRPGSAHAASRAVMPMSNCALRGRPGVGMVHLNVYHPATTAVVHSVRNFSTFTPKLTTPMNTAPG